MQDGVSGIGMASGKANLALGCPGLLWAALGMIGWV